MLKLKIRLIAAAIILFSAVFTAYSQAAIKTDKGYIFIKNEEKNSFTLEITGKEVATLESSNPMFQVDGKILQILIVPLTNFAEPNKKLTDVQLLELHKTWESDYLSNEVYKKKLTLEVENISFGQRKALFWGFVRPSEKENFDRDYFLTTVIGKYIVGVGSPVVPKDKKSDMQKFLTDIMKTLKVSDKEFDVDKMADEIRGKPAGK